MPPCRRRQFVGTPVSEDFGDNVGDILSLQDIISLLLYHLICAGPLPMDVKLAVSSRDLLHYWALSANGIRRNRPTEFS